LIPTTFKGLPPADFILTIKVGNGASKHQRLPDSKVALIKGGTPNESFFQTPEHISVDACHQHVEQRGDGVKQGSGQCATESGFAALAGEKCGA
jgi:hypothetical protein